MLGAFKKRWKPKRNTPILTSNTKDKLIESKTAVDKITSIPTRPIHLPCEEKHDSKSLSSGGDIIYPLTLTPNICVEDGRIEFIRSPVECANIIPYFKHETDMERADEEKEEDEIEKGKADAEKIALEARIRELEENLENERKLVQKEKLISAKLQRQLSRKELIQRDADRERRLRLDAESKLKLSMSEVEKCKTRLGVTQVQFARMEDTVRTMVQYKTKYEHIKHDKAILTRAYETRLLRLQDTISQLHTENQTLKRQIRNLQVTGFEEVQTALIERLDSLEIENCNLRQESDSQRRKYEKCLDDVANQVVRAILSQKALREEIVNIRRKLKDTENQNRALSSILLNHIDCGAGNTTLVQLRQEACMWLRPNKCLNFDTPCMIAAPALGDGSIKIMTENEDEEISGESILRDEGYSTMSSDMQCTLEIPRRGLEDVIEAQDETQHSSNSTTVLSNSSSHDKRFLKNIDSDVYVSVSLLLNSNPRHSFPPMNSDGLLSYQKIIRSMSDSHLCLKLPTPLTTSVMFSEKWNSSFATEEDVESWCSGDWWDADYVQHWLRLDESRCMMQQYDTSELEDWTMGSVREDDHCVSPCRSDRLLISPSTYDSWSSSSDNCSESLGTSLGVDFTRDFYRLVKFESTKSLSSTASVSSKDLLEQSQLKPNSAIPMDGLKFMKLDEDCIAYESKNVDQLYGGSQAQNQETNLNVETMDNTTATSSFPHSYLNSAINGYVQMSEPEEEEDDEIECLKEDFTYDMSSRGVSRNAMRTELNTVIEETEEDETCPDTSITDNIHPGTTIFNNHPTHQTDARLVAPIHNQNIRPIESSLQSNDSQTSLTDSVHECGQDELSLLKDTLVNQSNNQSDHSTMMTSLPSSLSTPDTVMTSLTSSLSTPDTVIHFNEKTTSKQVIDELNRMIASETEHNRILTNDEYTVCTREEDEEKENNNNLDYSCCNTGWIHVERHIDFTDPKARANLLDVMLASSRSSTSSESGEEDVLDYYHLHRLHRFRRQKKAAIREPLGVLRFSSNFRPSIIGRDDFYVRYGEKEKEAVSSFDFLENLSTASSSRQTLYSEEEGDEQCTEL